ncbi:DNA polymerase III subunit alpha [Algoriphagus namhaensis]|uniref:DNA-directed DNA polymerase n=1 Tax=Algoriphagus namhaensis TaxID=915353 RepID=A0ABV8AV84_9BACT
MYLNTHSYFSLRYGVFSTEQLLETAKQKKLKTMTLTDINNTSACMDFLRLAPKYDIKPVLGVDFRNSATQEFILLAQSAEGFAQINHFLSRLLMKSEPVIPAKAPKFPDTFIIYPFKKILQKGWTLGENELIGITHLELNQLRFSPLKAQIHRFVVLHPVTFSGKVSFNMHRLLRSIDKNMLLSKLPKDEQGEEWHQMLSLKELEEKFRDFPEILQNTELLLESCQIELDIDGSVPKNQRCYSENENLDFRLLRKLSYDGIPYRYPEATDKVYRRIEQELEIIRQKGFVSYFLINWKILKYARSKGYYYVGRGSGANSIIAYLLKITNVDPVELDLYFERFINLYRKNPPDFDIDFSWTDRDDVIEYIFDRFPHTALVAVYNTFQYRAAIRELGKVMGLPKHEIDVLTRAKGKFDYHSLDKLSQLVIRYASYLQDFPNYLGIHAGGIIISEKPIQSYCATFLPPKGFPTAQIDMVVAEDLGLYKFDILSQRGLGKIRDAVNIVEKNQGVKLDINDFRRFKEDERIKDILRNAKAIGCFYVESPAMRMLLKKLRVDHYLGLVAASSIIRPGVAKSGMMREYILRYRKPERRQDAHPVMLDIMPETFGVMVYQEDVIKVAHFFAGLDLGEADMLRRGMSGKFRSKEEFTKVKEKFFSNCKEKGYSDELTAEIWRQTESFAGYAFAKGHSASYAVESYQSLFLKAYYPLEYMVATINNGGGFYSRELYVHEARMNGGIIHAPCVNRSWLETVIRGKDIYLGFHTIQSLESNFAQKIIRERTKNGPFESLDDLIDRVSVTLDQLIILIKIDGLRSMGKDKRSLLWEAHMKINGVSFEEHMPLLFKTPGMDFDLPPLPTTDSEQAFDQLEHLGFTLESPFDLIKDHEPSLLLADDLSNMIGKIVTIDGYLVTIKNTGTSSGKRMYFGTFLDARGDFLDTVHFPPVAERYPFSGPGVYKITGKVMEEFECISIEVTAMTRLPIIEDPRYAA